MNQAARYLGAVVLTATLTLPAAHAGVRHAAKNAAVTTLELRIDVDAAGRVSRVEPTTAIPAPMVEAIRTHVAGWTFEAPVREGRTVAGTTYARMPVCAAPAPDGNGLVFNIGDAHNGPGMDPRMTRLSFFPPVPNAIIESGKFEMEVEYEVGLDGRARLDSLTTQPANPGLQKTVEKAFRKWLAPLRFQPERIDGQPVATRMKMPISYTFQRASSVPPARTLQREMVERSPACKTLLEGASESSRPQMAVDSPFVLRPSS